MGWDISVTNLSLEEESAVPYGEMKNYLLASWDANLGGLRWLDELVKEGKAAADKSGQGYPTLYFAKAKEILPVLQTQIPFMRTPSYLPTIINQERIEQCALDADLRITVWDQS